MQPIIEHITENLHRKWLDKKSIVILSLFRSLPQDIDAWSRTLIDTARMHSLLTPQLIVLDCHYADLTAYTRKQMVSSLENASQYIPHDFPRAISIFLNEDIENQANAILLESSFAKALPTCLFHTSFNLKDSLIWLRENMQFLSRGVANYHGFDDDNFIAP